MRSSFGGLKVAAAALALATLLPASHAADAPPAPAIDLAAFDRSTRPQDDLFRAFNGAWLDATPIPPDKSTVGTDTVLDDAEDEQLHRIVEDLAAQPDAAGNAQKVAQFYRAFVDEAAIDRAGLAPLRDELAAIAAVTTRTQLAAWFGRAIAIADGPMALTVDPDPKDPAHYRVSTWQSGLGLPDRDYYLHADARFVQARTAYAAYLAALLKLSGEADAERLAAGQLALEKRIATAHWDRVRTRDPVKSYNPMTLPQLARSAPGFDWAAFVAAAGLPTDQRIVVSQPGYASAMAALLRQGSLDDWKRYARLRLLDAAADVLPAPFRDARFAFRGVALQGLAAPRPRWKKALSALDGALGEALGEVYVERHFPPAAKARMQALVDNLLKAYGESMDSVPWMTPATRRQAQAKLAKIRTKIGYPDRWRDYAALEIRPGDACGNALRAARFEWARQAVRAGGPVDRDEWGMTPQTINAYYDASRNEIVFPAAILQPPYFDMAADDALNYGAIGATIGHEISHAFDDEGSAFDGDGLLRNWWTAADRKAFDALTRRLVAQYDAYQPLPGKRVNGRLTLGENIADLSGLQIAAKAYRLALGGRSAPVIDGFSGMQRLFIGWSQAWREKVRDEEMLSRLTADPHSPPAARANGAAVNSDDFHAAFETRPGDRMWKAPSERIRIW